MAGRFDQYISTDYIPIPFNELAMAGQAKQKQFDKTMEDEDKLSSLLSSIKSIPEHYEYKKELATKYNTELENLANQYLQDKDNFNYQRSLKRLARKFVNDEDRIVMEHTYEQAGKASEANQKIGKDYREYYDPYKQYIKSGYRDGKYDFRDPNTGTLRPFSYNGQRQAYDYLTTMQNMVKGIKESGYNIEKLISKDKFGNLIWKTEGKEGVDANKVKNIVNAQVDTFLQTPEGQHYIDNLVKGQAPSYAELPDEAKAKIRRQASNDLFAVAAPQIGGVNKQSYDYDSGTEWQYNINEYDAGSTTNMGAVTVPVDRNLYSDPQNDNSFFATFPLTKEIYANLHTKDPETVEFTESQNQVIDKASKVLGINVSSKKDKIDLLNKYLDIFSKQMVNPVVMEFPPNKEGLKLTEANNEKFFGRDKKGAAAIVNRPVKLIQGEGKKEMKGQDLLAEYGNREKYDINVTGDLTPDNFWYAAGKQITVTDKKSGEVVAQYAMQGDKQEQIRNGKIHDFYKSKYNPTGISETYMVNPSSRKLEKYKIEYEPITDNTLGGTGEGSDIQPIKIGEKVRLLDSKGNVVQDWIEDEHDAISKLYETLRK